jgi:hypothetical protein
LLASVFSVGLVAWFGLQVALAARTTARRGVIANAIAVLVNAVITFKVIHSGVRDAPTQSAATAEPRSTGEIRLGSGS